MTRKNSNPDLVPVFTPSLASVLFGCELEKGRPLTREEVIAIRHKSSTVLFRRSEAFRLANQRGYDDVDPVRCWETWQKLRKKLKPRPHT
jgi:hypothetical protein